MMTEMRIIGLLISLFLLFGAACTAGDNPSLPGNPGNNTLTIFAAASLAEAMSVLGDEFESMYPGIEVGINFAGSQQLAQQLSQGASADIYASADKEQMDNVIQAGRVAAESTQVFTHNRLAIVYPAENPGDIREFIDLAKPGLHLLLADEAVPVGRYAQEMLNRASKREGLGEEFKENVLKNVVSYEENVRAVLTKIVLGEADAGIVYESDFFGADQGDIKMMGIPEGLNITASYYVAPLGDSMNFDYSIDFIRFLLSPKAQEILADFGFNQVGEHE